ncbi:MAG: TetR family transcriptional regulator [Candidatus Lokiarchaeota archaeon]|nr:TetR family transcriptional regulator [Candidatus Lokiarchaeota archaeon]
MTENLEELYRKEKFQEIIEAAKELYADEGVYGFNMRALADKMGIGLSSLYNYIESKRELWYAVIIHYYSELESKMGKIANTHEGSFIDLVKKLIDFYFAFAQSDYKRFRFMYLAPIPKSENIGPFEKNYEPYNVFNALKKVIKQEISARNVNQSRVDINYITMYLFSIVHGAIITILELDWKEYYDEKRPKYWSLIEPSKFLEFSKKHIINQVEGIFSQIFK